MTLTDSEFELLWATPLFAGLETSRLTSILETISVATYAKGQTIFHAGDPAYNFYVVLSGWVRLHRTTQHGDEAIIGLFTRGETFGEAAMFLSRGFPATAIARVRTRLLSIDGRIMLDVIRKEPDVALGMLASMSQKLKTLVDHIALSRTKSTHERVAEFLASLCSAEKGSDIVELPFEK